MSKRGELLQVAMSRMFTVNSPGVTSATFFAHDLEKQWSCWNCLALLTWVSTETVRRSPNATASWQKFFFSLGVRHQQQGESHRSSAVWVVFELQCYSNWIQYRVQWWGQSHQCTICRSRSRHWCQCTAWCLWDTSCINQILDGNFNEGSLCRVVSVV